MPRVLGYTPPWLCRPAPAFDLFSGSATTDETGSARREGQYAGPDRTIAKRNTEIFVVAGKHIRWADLPSLKDEWQAIQETPSKKPRTRSSSNSNARKESAPHEHESYRTLKVSIGEPIRQLVIAPNGNLMAIVTSHTVHIAILPKSELLNGQQNQEPLKLKTYTIGPTTHVLSQSPVASVLWHPLGQGGNCLITITADCIVRLWEFNPDNRWSADSPAVATDLKKLAIVESEEDDVQPNRSSSNKVFSADAAGMDVASACMGGAGYDDESPWSAMTLWVAMKGGDVYALCPLLPSKWQPPSNLIPDLTTLVIENSANEDEEGRVSANSQAITDQLRWVEDLDNQEQFLAAGGEASEQSIETYRRPVSFNPVPKLQGPFQIFADDSEIDLELSDIRVIAAKSPNAAQNFDSESETEAENDSAGLSASIVCLLTREGRLYVCADVEGVEGQWLPSKPQPQAELREPSEPYLVVLEGLETIKTGEDAENEWPTFSEDVESPHNVFVTNSQGVYFFSFLPWIQSLERELQNDDVNGTAFRIGVFKKNISSLRERIIQVDSQGDSGSNAVPACLCWQDSDLGYFILTSVRSLPQAATLDPAHVAPIPFDPADLEYRPETPASSMPVTHAIYQPAQAFYAASSLPSFMATRVPSRYKQAMRDDIRLSNATLDVMTEAHRVLSKETHQLGIAAADLFRRCDQLLEILRNEVLKSREAVEKVDQVCTSHSGSDDLNISARQTLEARVERVKERQQALSGQFEKLRRKVRKIEGKDLTRREVIWKEEIDGIAANIEGEARGEDGEEWGDDGEHSRRYHVVKTLASDLFESVKTLTANKTQDSDAPGADTQQSILSVPAHIRKKKISEVDRALQQQTSRLEATQAKLQRLTVAGTVS